MFVMWLGRSWVRCGSWPAWVGRGRMGKSKRSGRVGEQDGAVSSGGC